MRLDIICKHEFPDGFDIDIDLSCEIQAMALFGPSGSGKTTILSTIAGIFTPNIARVAIDKQTITDTEKNIWTPIEQRSIGVTPQHSLLFEHKTVRENLEFGMPKHRKWKKTSSIVCQKKIDFDDAVEVLDLKRLLHRYPNNLSGGEQRRVAIGRAILSQPRLLILDEPLSALDHILQNRIMLYLKNIIDIWRIPTIIITHNTKVVHKLADSVVVIDRGRIISIGSPLSVLPVTNRSQISMAV
ncbi:MAG: ATP-binding cassette domain-containing protein [Sedimentisphaerales bacterium]|nr:ATP-binding cassette domain-containing protein [Sedimentisphaerales bacterium]